jgi:hypothetical protein
MYMVSEAIPGCVVPTSYSALRLTNFGRHALDEHFVDVESQNIDNFLSITFKGIDYKMAIS